MGLFISANKQQLFTCRGVLTEIYIEALLVDEELAEQVWEAWNTGEVDNEIACIA